MEALNIATKGQKYREDVPRAEIYREYHRRKDALDLRHPKGSKEWHEADQRLQRELGI